MRDVVKEVKRDCPLGFICYAAKCDPKECALMFIAKPIIFSWEK